MDANIIAAWTVILGFMGGTFHFFVLRPLNRAIFNLDKAIGELRMDLLTAEDRRHEMEKELIRIDNKCDRAHERVDEVERWLERHEMGSK